MESVGVCCDVCRRLGKDEWWDERKWEMKESWRGGKKSVGACSELVWLIGPSTWGKFRLGRALA